MRIKSYQDLIVWQRAMDVAKETYLLTSKLPKDEIYGMTSQMRRAAVSIPSNIAEGQSRDSTKEFMHFIAIAKGSIAELETQFQLCINIGYLTHDDIAGVMGLLEETNKMLNSLSKTLATKN